MHQNREIRQEAYLTTPYEKPGQNVQGYFLPINSHFVSEHRFAIIINATKLIQHYLYSVGGINGGKIKNCFLFLFKIHLVKLKI